MGFTEKYCSDAGSGSGDGSSAANARSWANVVIDINAGGTAGNRYNLLGPVARTTNTDTISGSGTATSPVIIRGYAGSIGDGYLGRTNGSGALITTNMPAFSYTTGRMNCSGSFVILESINFTGATATNAVITGATSGAIRHCVITSSSTTAAAAATGRVNTIFFNCDVSLTGASGGTAALDPASSGVEINCCRITALTGIGIRMSASNNYSIYGCQIYKCGTSGIETTNTGVFCRILGNTIVGCVDGIKIVSTSTVTQRIMNNLITDNTGYGINGVNAANAIVADYNRLDRNTLANTNLATDWLAATGTGNNTTVATQANEYVAYASNDFRLLPGSPARGAGMFPNLDIGAVQLSEVCAPSVGGRLVGR